MDETEEMDWNSALRRHGRGIVAVVRIREEKGTSISIRRWEGTRVPGGKGFQADRNRFGVSPKLWL